MENKVDFNIRFMIKARGKVVGLVESKENKKFLDKLDKLTGNDFIILKKCDNSPRDLLAFKALDSVKGFIHSNTK